jgi:hypothetical protein
VVEKCGLNARNPIPPDVQEMGHPTTSTISKIQRLSLAMPAAVEPASATAMVSATATVATT